MNNRTAQKLVKDISKHFNYKQDVCITEEVWYMAHLPEQSTTTYTLYVSRTENSEPVFASFNSWQNLREEVKKRYNI